MKIFVSTLALTFLFAAGDPLSAASFKPKARSGCGIKVVSYRFVGTPGLEFEYAGALGKIPAAGWIELIAKKGVDIAGSADDFGTVTVCLDGSACAVQPTQQRKTETTETQTTEKTETNKTSRS